MLRRLKVNLFLLFSSVSLRNRKNNLDLNKAPLCSTKPSPGSLRYAVMDKVQFGILPVMQLRSGLLFRLMTELVIDDNAPAHRDAINATIGTVTTDDGS